MEQDDCECFLYKFCNGSCYVFIFIDLVVCGLDIFEIENVVYYYLFVNEDGYIYCNGCIVCWEVEGNFYVIFYVEEIVFVYIIDELEEFILFEVIFKFFLFEYVILYIGKGKKDKINKIDIVGFFFKKGNFNKDEIGWIDVKDYYFFVVVFCKKIK